LSVQTNQQKIYIFHTSRHSYISGQEYLQSIGDGTPGVHFSAILRFEIYFATSGLQSHFASCCTDYSNVAEHLLPFDRGCE